MTGHSHKKEKEKEKKRKRQNKRRIIKCTCICKPQKKCSVQNPMFGFTLTLNLNLHSGSGLVVWLNQTSNIMFSSGLNNVREVWNRTAASLALSEAVAQAKTKPELPWMAWPDVIEGRSRLKPSQSQAGTTLDAISRVMLHVIVRG